MRNFHEKLANRRGAFSVAVGGDQFLAGTEWHCLDGDVHSSGLTTKQLFDYSTRHYFLSTQE
jgi:hypothetical protein